MTPQPIATPMTVATSPPSAGRSQRGKSPVVQMPKNGNADAGSQFPVMTKGDWCLVVAPEGEFPTLELFADLAGLKARLRELDQLGRSINAFPIFGTPMGFTPGPFRFMYLPDGKLEPVFDFSPYGTFIPNPDAKPAIDDHFCLGPEELHDGGLESSIVDYRRPVTPPHEPKKDQRQPHKVQREKGVPAKPSAPIEHEEALPLETCTAGAGTA